MKVICAWCQKVLKPGPPDPVSHGICQECAKRLEDEDEMPRQQNPTEFGPDDFLVKGGTIETALSETAELTDVMRQLNLVAIGFYSKPGEMREVARWANRRLQALKDQAGRGVHRNPSLVIFGNPGKIMTKDVQAILYHRDGSDYCHGFGDADITLKSHRDGSVTIGNLHERTGVEAHALPDGSVLLKHPHNRIWDER